MRRRRAYPALCAVVLLVVGQLAALAHQAAEQHVECEEHGEEVEAATLAQQLDQCEHDHWIAVEGDDGGEHEDCAIQRLLHQSTRASNPYVAPLIVANIALERATAIESVQLAANLYLIAPKTSPPV